MSRMLVVYYSWSNGNTKRIAEQLARRTGADIARIETVPDPFAGQADFSPFFLKRKTGRGQSEQIPETLS